MHSLIWILIRFSTLLQGESVTIVQVKAMFSGLGIPVLILGLVIGVPLMLPTAWEVVFRPSRGGIVWLQRYFKIDYDAGGKAFRLLLLVLAIAVAVLTWLHAVRELFNVKAGRVEPWNKSWSVANPGTKAFYGVILSIWS